MNYLPTSTVSKKTNRSLTKSRASKTKSTDRTRQQGREDEKGQNGMKREDDRETPATRLLAPK
jgi:hypothetical protein